MIQTYPLQLDVVLISIYYVSTLETSLPATEQLAFEIEILGFYDQYQSQIL